MHKSFYDIDKCNNRVVYHIVFGFLFTIRIIGCCIELDELVIFCFQQTSYFRARYTFWNEQIFHLFETVLSSCRVTIVCLCEIAKGFDIYSVALDENTDFNDTAQLTVYVSSLDDNFEMIEELPTVMLMHVHTTAHEIFHQLCDANVNAGLGQGQFQQGLG